jgi:hypothetical protein
MSSRVDAAEDKLEEAQLALTSMWLTEPDDVHAALLKDVEDAENELIQCKYTHFSAFPCRFA